MKAGPLPVPPLCLTVSLTVLSVRLMQPVLVTWWLGHGSCRGTLCIIHLGSHTTACGTIVCNLTWVPKRSCQVCSKFWEKPASRGKSPALMLSRWVLGAFSWEPFAQFEVGSLGVRATLYKGIRFYGTIVTINKNLLHLLAVFQSISNIRNFLLIELLVKWVY